MWLIAKYNYNELSLFKNNLVKKMGKKIVFFSPKIKKQINLLKKIKHTEKNILGQYIMCFSEDFKESSVLKTIQNLRGLNYILSGSKFSQKEINNFVNHCKEHENEEGFLNQSFFDSNNFNKGTFVKGPFTNFIFDIIESKKNTVKVLIGNTEINIKKNSDCLFQPI